MKQSLFILSLAALTLASCSQDEVIDVNHNRQDANRIGFRVRSGKHARSMEYSTANLDKFNVYGWLGEEDEVLETGNDNLLSYFEGGLPVTFSKGEDNIFTSALPYYWPTDGSWLHLVAYAPYSLQTKTIPFGGIMIENFTVNSDITLQEDIICTTAGGNLEEDEPDVELTFEHALTKVFISKVMNSDTRYKYEIAGVKFGNISNSGEFQYRGEKCRDREDVENGLFDNDGYVSDPTGYGMFWKPAAAQSSDMVYIFDEPLVLDSETTSVYPMSGNDTGAEDAIGFQDGKGKGSFMLIPQKLSYNFVGEDKNYGTIEGQAFDADMSYIALLVRITYLPTGKVIYPYAAGVEDITETVGEGEEAVAYAWAAFPVSSFWRPSTYVDYAIDFSKGAGYVAPGASAEWALKPILGREIKFTEEVFLWRDYTEENVNQNGSNNVDGSNTWEDPDWF